jgi:hypothetical protein
LASATRFLEEAARAAFSLPPNSPFRAALKKFDIGQNHYGRVERDLQVCVPATNFVIWSRLSADSTAHEGLTAQLPSLRIST